MSEGCHLSANPLSFKIPFSIFIEHKFPFDEGCDKVHKAPWTLFGEGRTPQQAYHLILKPTLSYESFISIFEKTMSALRLLSTELMNFDQIGLAVIRRVK